MDPDVPELLKQHQEPQESRPKQWRWNENYQYPIPQPNGDHWDIIFERLLEKDRAQCDTWKDEVQNLLIFAGLFSAVVTGFVVQSYQQLQSDPNADMVALLSRIAAVVETLSNNTGTNQSQSAQASAAPFSPPSLAVQINTFWFSSLILSLTTVIIGIVCLQWLREHQRYAGTLTSKQSLAIFHLRATSLERWHVPHIFNSLPLLLQTSVVLFFIGLTEFLLSLNETVAVPAVFLISLSVLFLIVTTVFPALQVVTGRFVTEPGEFIPTPCPYKSPQSWIFRQLFLFLEKMISQFWRLLTVILWPVYVKDSCRKFGKTTSWAVTRIFGGYIPTYVSTGTSHLNWLALDMSWLSFRDHHFLRQQGNLIDLQQYNIGPTYDLVQTLIPFAQEHSVHESGVASAYHAYKELCDVLINDQEFDYGEYDLDVYMLQLITQARLAILQSCFPPFRSIYFRQDGVRVVRDETLLLFLFTPSIKEHSSLRNHIAGIQHKMELATRMLVYNFHRGNLLFPITEDETDRIYWLIFDEHHEDYLSKIPTTFFEDIVYQHYMLLAYIFERAYSYTSSTAASASMTGYPLLLNYFQYVSWFCPTEQLEQNYLSVLQSVSKGLNNSLDSNGYDKADFLFFCGRLYLERLAHQPWFCDLMRFGSSRIRFSVLEIINTMLRYKQRLDKHAYVRSETLWRWELHPLGERRTTRTYIAKPITIYQPIPEVLLRYIPYEYRRLEYKDSDS